MELDSTLLDLVQVHGLSRILQSLSAVCDKYAVENLQEDALDVPAARTYQTLSTAIAKVAAQAMEKSL